MGIRARIRVLVWVNNPRFFPEERQRAAGSGRMDPVTIWGIKSLELTTSWSLSDPRERELEFYLNYPLAARRAPGFAH